MAVSKLDEVVSLAKRRGFVFPAGEIYGGTRSAWDYGPLGVALKDNIKREWWRYMVTTRGDVVGVDTSVILPSQVWVASGHVSVFNDPLIECLNCHKRHRADKLEESYAEKHGDKMPENGLKDIACPDCGTRGNWTEPRDFNMMLRTHLGPVEDENSLHYLRPETAQGIFVDFKNVMTSTRQKPPFGIANIGKSFRNEITPGNFIFRTREFEQMEMEFFVEPGTDEAWHQYWIDTRVRWYVDLGVNPENLRMYEHPKEKLSHYSKRTVDIEYKFGFQGSDWGELEGIANIGKSFRNEITPGNFIFRTREFEQMEMEFFVEPGTDEAWHQYWIDTRVRWYVDLGVNPENLRMYEHPKEKLSHYSKRTVDIEYKFGFQGSDWGELEGIANRTDYDLSAHSKHSGEDLSYFNQATGEKYVPYVIEPAAGLTRSLMAFLVDAYDVDEAPNTKGGVDKRTVLRLDPRLAPVKAAVLPLSKKPELQSVAQDLAADLRQHDWVIDYDEAGAIGRRYRREDEIGTPLCVTVDFDTLEDHAVTIRERDTMSQERVSLDKVADYVAGRINEKRVKYPQGPVEIVGTRAADGAMDVAKEAGEDESQPVKIAQAGGLY